MKKKQNGTESLRRLKLIVGCNASKEEEVIIVAVIAVVVILVVVAGMTASVI